MRRLLLVLLSTAFLSSCATNSGFFVGEEHQVTLPNVSAPDQYGRKISLRDYATKEYLLVFFYPRADTPG